MADLYVYEYNQKTYHFRMSNKALVEIEKRRMQSLERMSDPDVIMAIQAYNKASDELKGLGEEEKEAKTAEIMAKMLPAISKVDSLGDNEIDNIELGYILLHSLSSYEQLTHAEYDLMIEDMEDKMGFEEVQEIFKEMSDKVFMMIEKISGDKKPASTRSTKGKKKPVMN